MINNKLTLLAAAAALAQQVSGLSAHQHLHRSLEQRALAAEARVAELEARGVVVETVWEYFTTTVKWSPGQEAPVATQPAVVQAEVADAPAAPAAVPTTLAKVVAPAPEAAAPKSTKTTSSKKSKATSGSGSNSGSPSSGSPFSGKRGIAYNDASLANTFGGECESCCWGYNWASRRDDFSDKFDYVPMLWGNRDNDLANWQQDASDMISQGSKALFSFNEPDIASQSNMSPGEAASLFKSQMNGFHGKALIGAPSVSNSGNANEGLDWLQQFVDACNGECQFDFANIHWYSQPQYSDTLFEHIQKAHEITGKPVWLTEFGPIDSDDASTDAFIQDVIPKLDNIDYLDAYSYFMVSQDHLMSGSGLSAAGKLYATVA
jgi:hypothetical protein